MRLSYGILFLLPYVSKYVTAGVESDLIKDEIVPDALDKAPNELLRVFINNKQLNYGEEWLPTSMIPTPTVEWNSDPSSFYTLVLESPDAPSRAKPTYKEAVMWLVGNIPGADLSKGDLSGADTIVEYVGPAPPIDGGVHRILFTLYKQPAKLSFDEKRIGNRQLDYRLWWSQRVFIRKYKLGDPVAANLVFSRYDDYVPKLYQEFMDRLSNS